MSADPRPNLGGLFNGSTPPERSSSISGAFGPRFLKQLPVEQPAGEVPPEPAPSANIVPSEESATDAGTETAAGQRWQGLSSMDPNRIVEQYFAFLQVLLDTNREWAVALTSTVMSLPKRVRSQR
jgi:hypothetical protein